VDYSFAVYLDNVRDDYGFPIVLTSDGRTPAENTAAGGVPDSRHLFGQAADVEFPPTANHLLMLVEACIKRQVAFPLELEIDSRPESPHVHIAWKVPGRAGSLEVH